MSSFAVYTYLYIEADITKYLVNVIIFPFHYHTKSSYYYWHGCSFKVSHFFQFLFIGLCIYLSSNTLTDMLLFIGEDISIRCVFLL